MTAYDRTLSRVETYFDQTATKTWERLTSDAPVSRVRETVRAGRDRMRETMLNTLGDVRGKRILDAGCGAGQMTHELALRGAEVVAVDISPSLVEIARKRLPDALSHQVTFHAGDMLDSALGDFDHVVAMDSLIYYDAADINRSISTLFQRTSCKIVFTVAPRTPFLMAFFGMGKLFPRRDRSPVMIPHAPKKLARLVDGNLRSVARISSGFYISECLEVTK
ncbi:magnesium protoporphyrin IX methyltransferase [Nereida ignava]|uniref:Magnesium protoporphyrin IX methyltransferase n=1 Tax=Nereida ignava TaxID=282199 RepID=A0A0U1NP81_9RHOB|nr:magnesium protoporphyrin IX methyltransferase [Nereida ignava]CRK76528.1 Magnesium-protoporphyrin O-methyltransferase [Nereida ignava]SFJ73669.1 Mg-protoporphyrin IX methyltransferase [Nereida ignava DSM 16309]